MSDHPASASRRENSSTFPDGVSNPCLRHVPDRFRPWSATIRLKASKERPDGSRMKSKAGLLGLPEPVSEPRAIGVVQDLQGRPPLGAQGPAVERVFRVPLDPQAPSSGPVHPDAATDLAKTARASQDLPFHRSRPFYSRMEQAQKV